MHFVLRSLQAVQCIRIEPIEHSACLPPNVLLYSPRTISCAVTIGFQRPLSKIIVAIEVVVCPLPEPGYDKPLLEGDSSIDRLLGIQGT